VLAQSPVTPDQLPGEPEDTHLLSGVGVGGALEQVADGAGALGVGLLEPHDQVLGSATEEQGGHAAERQQQEQGVQ